MEDKKYYKMTGEEVRREINGGTAALDSFQISQRQQKYGPNEIHEGKKKSYFQIFLEQFKDFLVIILIISALVSLFLGEAQSAVVILAVITLNAVLGTVQTIKAERSLSSLKKLSAPTAKVLRDGAVKEIPGSEVTVGDEVFLEAGDYIPADGRILENAGMKIDESALTGESVSVEKDISAIAEDTALADRRNMLYSGTFVTYGRGSFLVTSIGMNTEVGKIAGLLKSASEKKTPLQRNLDSFGKKLSVIILILCAVIFLIQVYRGGSVPDAFLFAVALAVAAIPEALSSIVTIVLSFGTQKMAREGAVIRKLQAVEGLGSVSVICSDKTGTLTQNRMTVEHYYADGMNIDAENIDPDNPLHKQVLRLSILCNDSYNDGGQEIGDPTETAMINLGAKLGVPAQRVRSAYPRLSELPFDSDRKLMSTFHLLKDGYTMITKGAPDVILRRSAFIQRDKKTCPLSEDDVTRIDNACRMYSEKGLRVLGLAYKRFDCEKELEMKDENDLVFLGLIAMMDPPRPESAKAVEKCREAGIKPVMITGDHKTTASAIAKKIGILQDSSQACEGAVIDSMSDEELNSFVQKVSVFARVTPEHKIRIVKAWQDNGNVVAMTGDGVNDAPALKQADIGVAMGITGSEVSKDAASMVLTDDNFATIVKAVENGRNVYANIKNSIKFLLSGNFAAILAVVFASVLALPVPFAAVQLLFINLLTDSLPAIALGLEPHTSSVMRQKPRPMNESILTGAFLRGIGIEGLCIGVMTMIAYMIGYKSGGAVSASTMAFGTLCMSRLVHGYNCKSESPVMFTKRFFNNVFLQGAFILGMFLISAVLLLPAMQSIFQVQTLSLTKYLAAAGLAGLNLPVIQLLKKLREKLRPCK